MKAAPGQGFSLFIIQNVKQLIKVVKCDIQVWTDCDSVAVQSVEVDLAAQDLPARKMVVKFRK